MSRALKAVAAHWKAAILTFEIFWIVVFLLEAANSAAPPEAMQFVYANF